MELTNEMARIASGIKLADQWEEKWNEQADAIKKSTRLTRIIDYLKDNESGTLKAIAQEKFNSTDTAAVNQQVRFLKQAGIIEDAGLVSPKKEKTSVNADGVKGRPKLTNDDVKTLGVAIIRKFAKGDTNFTLEEIDLITQLHTSATSIAEETNLDDHESHINEERWQKIAGI